MNLGSDPLANRMTLGVSNVSRIHFGFKFIVNPDLDPIIKYALSFSGRNLILDGVTLSVLPYI